MRQTIRFASTDRVFRGCGCVFLSILCCALTLAGGSVDADSWQLRRFVRPPEASPVITPRKESVFVERTEASAIHWEALNTFKPAAIVRKGKIYVLYRAEDDSGENK